MALEGSFPQESQLQSAESSGKELSLLSVAGTPALSTDSRNLLSSSENPLVHSVKNASAVYSELLPGLPGAVAGELKSDLTDNTASTMLKVSTAAALGLGASVLLARSPVLAKTLLGAAGIGTTALLVGDTIRFTGAASAADTLEEQSRLAAEGKASAGKFAATLLETSPGLIAGTGGGLMLADRIGALDSVALAVRNVGEVAARRIVPEGFHYLSLDAKTASKLGQSGELDLLQASKQWLQDTPWRGVEDGRFFKINAPDALKASARIPGSVDRVLMGHAAKQVFHTHESSILPTSGDYNSVFGTGVIGVPKAGILSFYEGTGAEAQNLVGFIKAGKMQEAAQAAETLHARTFSTLIVAPEEQLSMRVDMHWNPASNRLEPSSVSTLDFGDTVNNLSKWNGRLNIDTIKSAADELLKPGMTDLLKLLPKDEI